MSRDYGLLIFSLTLLVFLFHTSLAWYKSLFIWFITLLIVYTIMFQHDYQTAKHIKGIQWKEGMVITMMKKNIFPYSMYNPFFVMLRLSGCSYLHSAIVVSDPNYPSDGRSPTKLRVLELISLDVINTPGKKNHDYSKFQGKINSYPLEEYLQKVDESGTLLYRIYTPPPELSCPLNQQAIESVRKNKSHFCIGFSYEYLHRLGHLTNPGYQAVPLLFRYTPIHLDTELQKSGWKRDVYKK